MPYLGTWEAPRLTGVDAVAMVRLIPPMAGAGVQQNGVIARGFTHVSTLCYTTQGTAHVIGFMRPFNYTTFDRNVASGATVNVFADPGLYSTVANWKYSPIQGGAPVIANNAIAASDYVAYQAADGTWYADTVSAVSTLAITLTNNLPTGGVKAGGLFYFFGVIGDSDPNTGQVNPQTKIAANATRDKTWNEPCGGSIVHTLHEGDPMLFYSPNSTNAGSLEVLCGYYSRF
jgi:hypothetical protein